MALDKGLSQTINLKTNGDALLRPLQAMGNQLNRLVQQMEQVANPSTKKGRDEVKALARDMDRVVATAKTLQSVLANGTNSGRASNRLFSGLDEQSMGKKVMSASKLKRELDGTKSSADALEIRLAQLYKSFNALGQAGRSIGQRDINKALNTEVAIKQVRRLEQEIAKLDARQKLTGKPLTGDASKVWGDLQSAQGSLLKRVQTPSRANWQNEITQVQALTERYRALTKVEQEAALVSDRAAQSRRRAIMQQANASEPQLRSQLNSGASKFAFTPDQARGFDIRGVNQQIKDGTDKLMAYQAAMAKAVAGGRSQAVVDRLGQSFKNLSGLVSEATAKRKAFDALPENKMKALNNMLLGNWKEFGTRIAGASIISTGVFAAINALQGAAQYVVQLEDAMAKLQAISGATDTEMSSFSKTIVQLGSETRFSTLEIAQAATQIVQAGYSAAEAGGVLKASLMLASGSGSTVAEGIETMTSSLGAFQLQAGEAGRVADVLMSGLNQSKLGINQMQAALQYAGATAKETGMSLEELVAIAGSLANAGIKNGSTIGTGVRQLIVDLQTPSDKFQKELKSLGLTIGDVDIRSQSLAQVVQKLTDAGFSAESAYESFEVRAASAFLAFRNQIDVYEEMSIALTQSGAAAKANAQAMDSLAGSWTKTKNTLGELVVVLSQPFLNALQAALDGISGVVGGINSMISALAEASGATGNWGGIITGALLPALAGFFVGGPLGAAIGAVLGFAGALHDAADASDELAAATDKSTQEMAASRQTVSSVDDAISRLVDRGDSLKKNHVSLQVEVLNLTGKFEGLAGQLNANKLGYEDLMSAMVRYRGLKLAEEGEKAREVIGNAKKEGTPVLDKINAGRTSMGVQANNLREFGPQQFRNAPALLNYQKYANESAGKDYGRMDGEGFLQETVALRGVASDLRELIEKTPNTYISAAIKKLEDQLASVQEMGEIRAKITSAQITQGLVKEINSPGGQARDTVLLNTRQKVTEGLNLNKDKSGSGDAILEAAQADADKQLRTLRNQQKAAPAGSVKHKAIGQSILDLDSEKSRITRASDRASEDLMKDEKAGAGENLTGANVAALIQKEFKGSNPYSYQKRPYSEQVALYAKYKAGTGPLAAKPGTSNHGTGHALDMTPIPGMDIDQVSRFLESKGLEITEALAEKNPKSGKVHWHFAWKPKTSKYGKQQEAADDKAAKELEQLIEAEAGFKAGSAQKRIEALIAEAKAGNKPVADLQSQFETAAVDYASATLNKYDVENPTAGLGASALKQRALTRAALEEKLAVDVQKYFADFFRAVGDQTIDVLNRELAASQRVLDDALRETDNLRKGADREIDKAGNRTNQFKYGTGTAYVLERRKEAANDNADLADISSKRQKILSDSIGLVGAEEAVNALPEGEAKKAQLEAIANNWAKIKEELAAVLDLQAQYDARKAPLQNVSLGDRLQGATSSWLENSGANDNWSKRLEDSIGPGLDNLTSGFGDFFSSIADGSKSVKAGLNDMLWQFGKFVEQMLIQALALEAVKGLLSLVGLSVPGSYNGGLVKTSAPADFSYNAPGRYDGGYINRGHTTRDSALYNLAAGEFVTRSKSVREIGVDNMETINKHGAAGLSKVAGAASNVTNIQAPRQETNVYVVQDKQRPQLGKNDILVTIQEDILQGGLTKKLIKQVGQGG